MSKTSTRTTMAARAASALLLAASAALAGASAALLIGCGQRGPLYLPPRQQTTPPSPAPTAPTPPATPPPPAPAATPPPPPLTEAQTTDQAQAMPRCLIHIKRSPQRHRTVGSHFEFYLHERHRPP